MAPPKNVSNTPVLEELTRFQVINSIPGMVCAVLHRGKVVLEVGSGFANVETLAPMKTDTVCRIGSISKDYLDFCVARAKRHERSAAREKPLSTMR